ncbi:MAG: hypothetical protein EXQ91_09475 [Alphaproteobacteria bacterium]|nr:hypothetical protein [Alphaproteobacteria bacterium]
MESIVHPGRAGTKAARRAARRARSAAALRANLRRRKTPRDASDNMSVEPTGPVAERVPPSGKDS